MFFYKIKYWTKLAVEVWSQIFLSGFILPWNNFYKNIAKKYQNQKIFNIIAILTNL